MKEFTYSEHSVRKKNASLENSLYFFNVLRILIPDTVPLREANMD